ncbi:MAG: D-2-hydroxyacid dehydrogenase family protein [Chloroflexi bacterium]|nr:D-2-hydroxyacid dehydrogenase family protein [Chloroflexota bacterium]
MVRVAILDDYQKAALHMADWSQLSPEVMVDTFQDHLFDEDALVRRLEGYDIVLGMRERTPIPRSLLQRLPALKMLISTGMSNASFDIDAATDLGVVVTGTTTGGGPGTTELTWGHILALARKIPQEDQAVREGKWQISVGQGLRGKTLGIIGLGNIGSAVARVGAAFQMKVLAWSQNLTPERAKAGGAAYATKDNLLRQSDFVTIHLRLSERTTGLLGARELALMKSTAYLINTSRGPIVDEKALVQALQNNTIAGAGLDVHDIEPLPADHPLRRLGNTVVTPHLGYVTEEGYRGMFTMAVENIQTFLKGQPTRVINPAVLERPNLRGIQ